MTVWESPVEIKKKSTVLSVPGVKLMIDGYGLAIKVAGFQLYGFH